MPGFWPWRDAPAVRVAGAFLSWAGYITCFTLLFLVSYTVGTLGGSCASGGPYVIEVPCPDNVALFAPTSIFGGFLFAGVALLFAGGFGAPLVVWAWPILFVGLSVPFFLSIPSDPVLGILLGLMFFVMGIVPVVFLLRQPDAWQLFLGVRDVTGRPFLTVGDRRRFGVPRAFAGASERSRAISVPPRAIDWALSLGITAVAIVCGVVAASALWSWTA